MSDKKKGENKKEDDKLEEELVKKIPKCFLHPDEIKQFG